MLAILLATGAAPSRLKFLTFGLTLLTALCNNPMIPIGVLAKTPHIHGAVHRNVEEALALAFRDLALDHLVLGVQRIVILEPMITETLGSWPNTFAGPSMTVDPPDVAP